MPSVSTKVCDNFAAAPGSGMNWIDPPVGCTINAASNSPWPFNVGPPIKLPSPATVMIKPYLQPGTYYFQPSCCKSQVSVKVT
ncbi:MAG: hypothetical protein WB510_13305 [Candidatus Sulfotelmatobacter sp.]